MSKSVLLFLSLFLASAAFAQNTYRPLPGPVPPKSTHQLPVLSPEDYKKKVNALTQENKAILKQQVDQTIKSRQFAQPVIQAMPAAAPPAPSAPPAAQSYSIQQPVLTPSSVQQHTDSISPIQSTTDSHPRPGTAPTLPTLPQAPGAPIATPTQTQVYTGFQAPPAANTPAAAPSTQQKAPAWNIKY